MIERLLPAGPRHRVCVRISDRRDGDFHVEADGLERRRQAFAPGAWSWLQQVHGADIVDVSRPGDGAGTSADAAVTTAVGAVLAVQTADCVPVVLVADGGVAVAHAGWRGIVEGVVPATVDALRARTRGAVRAFVGPHIRVDGYEFGVPELDAVAQVAGEQVRGRTADGRPALDMTAAVCAVLDAAGVEGIEVDDADTADPAWFSHRTRGDRERQVTAAWLEPVDD